MPDDDFDAYLAASGTAEAQYAEALFDMAIAYPQELPFIYTDLFPDDEDDIDSTCDPVAEKVKELASRSAIAQDLVVELAGLATVPSDYFRELAEALTRQCRAGRGDRKELRAVLDLVEVCKEYENAMADALEAHNAWGPPSLTVLKGGLAPTAPKSAAVRAHLTVVR